MIAMRASFKYVYAAAFVSGILLQVSGASLAQDGSAQPPEAAGGLTTRTEWVLRLPPEGRVLYRGVVNLDAAGAGAGSTLYPAPNAAGFIAAVITHALIIDSAKKSQKEQLQASADKVLLPYKTSLDSYTYRDLMGRVAAKYSPNTKLALLEETAESGQSWTINAAPIFFLTQDQKALVMENVVVIHRPGASVEQDFRATIRVVSSPRESIEPNIWATNEGEKLKDLSASLVGESLAIAMREAVNALNAESIPYRTIRYKEGASEKIERAQVLSNQCNRLLLRTLRGSLMSVPVELADSGQCTPDKTALN